MLKDFVCPLKEKGCPFGAEGCTVPLFHYCNHREDVQVGYGTPDFELEVRRDFKTAKVRVAA